MFPTCPTRWSRTSLTTDEITESLCCIIGVMWSGPYVIWGHCFDMVYDHLRAWFQGVFTMLPDRMRKLLDCWLPHVHLNVVYRLQQPKPVFFYDERKWKDFTMKFGKCCMESFHIRKRISTGIIVFNRHECLIAFLSILRTKYRNYRAVKIDGRVSHFQAGIRMIAAVTSNMNIP
jgi:hypothetical protein